MALVRPQDWRPRGIDDLEPDGWRALRQDGSTCIVAGPGAGKTEFLAQRAAYLLETGLCPAPCRVLAISFKGDAADNLAARVGAPSRWQCVRSFPSAMVHRRALGLGGGPQARLVGVSSPPCVGRHSKPQSLAFGAVGDQSCAALAQLILTEDCREVDSTLSISP